jgi:hypothetical protein
VLADHHHDALLQAAGRLPLGVVDQRQVQVRLLDACDAPPAWEQHSPPGRAIRRWVGGCLNLTKAARLIMGVVIDRSTHFMDCLVLCMQDSAIGVRNCRFGCNLHIRWAGFEGG